MEYVAKLAREGRYTLIEFPDCEGCQTFSDPEEGEDAASVAREALEGWLVAHLVDGEAPPPPISARALAEVSWRCVSPRRSPLRCRSVGGVRRLGSHKRNSASGSA